MISLPAPVFAGSLYAGEFPEGERRYRLTLTAELRHVEPDRQHTDHTTGPALELSIQGDLRDTRRRHSDGGGQNLDDLRRLIAHIPPTAYRDDLRAVLAAWERWHLNAMRSACIHQAEEWTCHGDKNAKARASARLMLDHQARELRRKADPDTEAGTLMLEAAGRLEAAANAAAGAIPVEPCGTLNGWPVIRSLFGEHPYPKRGDACHVCEANRWDEPTDHCPETGYRFGTSWLVEPLPDDVADLIRRVFTAP